MPDNRGKWERVVGRHKLSPEDKIAHKRASSIRWRDNNLEQARAKARSWMKANPEWKRNYRAKLQAEMDRLKAKPCRDCGCSFPPECMDFDHVRGEKKANIGAMDGNYSKAEIMDEIAKCDLVCANCHRIRTRKRMKLN